MERKLNASWVLLAGALVFGGLAVFAASRYISKTVETERARLNPHVATVDVVVAKVDIDRGETVGSNNMAVRQVPKEFVPGTVVDPQNFGAIEGARLAVPMRAGEMLLRGTLEGADAATFSATLKEGVRAITLTVDEVNSLSGLLQPHDHVDLFYTARPPLRYGSAASQNEKTYLLLQDVSILATGRQVRPSMSNGGEPGVGRGFTTITIEAQPRDAQRLILAQKSGHLTAVLRGVSDRQPLVASAMDVTAIFGEQSTAKSSAPRQYTEIIVGGGGRLERELLAMSAAAAPRRKLPDQKSTAAESDQTPDTTAHESEVIHQAMQQLLEAANPPAEAISMTR